MKHSKYCCYSITQSCWTLCDSMDWSTPGFPVLHHLLELAQIRVQWVGDVIQPSRPPAFNLSQNQGLFQWVCSSYQVAKVLELHFSVSPSNEYTVLISFRIGWFDLLGSKGLLRVFSSTMVKASILYHSAFFIIQLSHLYMTAGKTIALTIWTLVGKVMSLFFNMLSRFLIAFLPKSKCLLISWLQLQSSVILESEVCYCFHCFPICHEVMEPDTMILVFWMLSFKPAFSLSSFTFIKRLFNSSLLSAIGQFSSVRSLSRIQLFVTP